MIGGLTACIGIGNGTGRGRGNRPTPGGERIAVAKNSLMSFRAMISFSWCEIRAQEANDNKIADKDMNVIMWIDFIFGYLMSYQMVLNLN